MDYTNCHRQYYLREEGKSKAAKSKDNQKESKKKIKNSTLPLLWMKLLKTDIVYGKKRRQKGMNKPTKPTIRMGKRSKTQTAKATAT